VRTSFTFGILASFAIVLATGWASYSAELRVQKGIKYREVNGEGLTLDTYESPAYRGRRPAVLLFAGGGMYGVSESQLRLEASMLAARGFKVFWVRYRTTLARDEKGTSGGQFRSRKAYRFPAPICDAQAAVRWVRDHAGQFGVDPHRLGAVGFSAGGHLAAMLGLTEGQEQTSSRVQAVVNLSGRMSYSDEFLPKEIRNDPKRRGEDSGRAYLRPRTPPEIRRASAISHINASSVPFFHVHGKADLKVDPDNAIEMHELMEKVGVDTKLALIPGMGHVLSHPGWNKERIAEFLSKKIGLASGGEVSCGSCQKIGGTSLSGPLGDLRKDVSAPPRPFHECREETASFSALQQGRH
jgi:acetyl esterase/lipase